ncbi:ubiquitin conjugation factor E4 A [Patella vulgata]|uniref:ubiquitin conjugation factor E4 A n=1 Tax=Patella vulgata TaxID=6465 RepID=UPI00217F2581|nr:ubiquitin conjugation factor E4 A [Patella vulgata]
MDDTEKNIEDNPFAALFPSISQAQQFSSEKQQKLPEEKISVNVEAKLAVSKLIEDIFLLTLEKDCDARTESYVYLEDLAERMDGQTWMDTDTLSQAVFERLMLDSPQEFIKKPVSKSLAGEPLVLPYLSQSYNRVIEYRQQQKSEPFSSCIKECKSVIILNAKTCLLQTELFPSQSLYQQFIDVYLQESGAVFGDDSGQIIDFFVQVMDSIDKDEDGNVEDVMIPILDLVKAKFTNMSLISAEKSQYIHLCKFFSKTAAMAEAFMKYNTPKDIKSGKEFESTLIGSMLSLSCIPKNEAGPYDFFNDPSSYRKHVHDSTESNIWAELVTLNEKIYLMTYSLIKVSPHIRHLVLKWLGKCLAANQGRTKIWSNQMPQLFNQLYSSEGFCLNLNYLMLKLCQPFCEPMSAKLLKIQCSYTQAVGKDEEDIKTRCIHAGGLREETCLIPAGDENTPNTTETYNFITECFFLTQQCINLGFHTLHNKFTKLNQDLHRVQRLYQDVRQQSASEEVEPVRSIKAQMEKGMTLFLSMKAALTVPQLLEMSLNLHTSTATWLSQMAASDTVTEFKPIALPLPETAPTSLSLIPEFVMGNLNDFISFLHRYQDELFEFAGDKVKYFMTLILVFMGNPERMNNPHLRAELAETLSSLMPPDPNQKGGGGLLAKFHREKLFSEHELIDHLAEKLLHVFVSIEMTGQSVEFEQKFNYRRPMYIVLEYIWEIDVHKQAIKNLSDFAERNIDAPEAPLFLRFINLLINDAIFLLDEALSYMMQIKEKQQEKERGEWDSQDQRQRQQTEANFRFMGNIARYHNVMANYTIHSLELLTREIKTIFCNSTMVDRIAAMLNYFLLHLVGPKQKNFNVKDKNDYEFKPQQIVSDITKIYLNLGDSDEFCQAVCNDGRSYSTDLFPKTVQVLQKIGSDPIMISDFLGLDDKIRGLNEKTQAEDDLVEDAPEEFLDPILGNLMRDPVLLPTSGTIIDRSVISRHILSDQTDPFNRAPLTMDMVVPQTDLKNKIEQWRKDKAKS